MGFKKQAVTHDWWDPLDDPERAAAGAVAGESVEDVPADSSRPRCFNVEFPRAYPQASASCGVASVAVSAAVSVAPSIAASTSDASYSTCSSEHPGANRKGWLVR